MNEKITIISPRPAVEVYLPDGRVLSGPRGAKVGEFLQKLEYDSQLVAAIVNGDLRELTYPIEYRIARHTCDHVLPRMVRVSIAAR